MTSEQIRKKQTTFASLAKRFEACGDGSLWMRLLVRETDDCIVSDASQGKLEQIETFQFRRTQYLLQTYPSFRRPAAFEPWLSTARVAGNELSKMLGRQVTDDAPGIYSQFPLGVTGWLVALGQSHLDGTLHLPMQHKYVNEASWLEAIKLEEQAVELTNRGEFQQASELKTRAQSLWQATNAMGKEYLFEDVIAASALFSYWLSENAWPYEEESQAESNLESVVEKQHQGQIDSEKTAESVVSESRTQDGNTIQTAALRAAIEGGLAGLVRLANSAPSSSKVSATMQSMLNEDSSRYAWTVDDWADKLGCSKKTIVGNKKRGIAPCDAWREILLWRESNKASREQQNP